MKTYHGTNTAPHSESKAGNPRGPVHRLPESCVSEAVNERVDSAVQVH